MFLIVHNETLFVEAVVDANVSCFPTGANKPIQTRGGMILPLESSVKVRSADSAANSGDQVP